jgi:DNA-binding GntR family transcriptional regulator
MDAEHLEPGGESGEPLWRRIERSLQGEIASGLLAPGARMPSEPELAARFAAHRHTVRRAIAALAQRGLVRVEQGRGSFVHDDVITYAVGRRTRVEENLLARTAPSRGDCSRPGRGGDAGGGEGARPARPHAAGAAGGNPQRG